MLLILIPFSYWSLSDIPANIHNTNDQHLQTLELNWNIWNYFIPPHSFLENTEPQYINFFESAFFSLIFKYISYFTLTTTHSEVLRSHQSFRNSSPDIVIPDTTEPLNPAQISHLITIVLPLLLILIFTILTIQK